MKGPMIDASEVHNLALGMSARYLALYREQAALDQANGTNRAVSLYYVSLAYQDMANEISRMVGRMIR